MPFGLFFLFAVRISESSCGGKGESCPFAARLGDGEYWVFAGISDEEDFIEVRHSMLFLLLLINEVLSNSFHGHWSSIYYAMVRSRFFFDLICMVSEIFEHEASSVCNGFFDEDVHGVFPVLV